MPRIPLRTEPYSSPSRQHRHFKNKRDQVLRSLGKSAYINGSHFAIMWVTASGQVETYASDAFQERLEDWFEKSGISEEGKKLVLSGAHSQQRSSEDEQDAVAGPSRLPSAGQAASISGEEDDDEDDEDDNLSTISFATRDNASQSGRRASFLSAASPRSRVTPHLGKNSPLPATEEDVFGGSPPRLPKGTTGGPSPSFSPNGARMLAGGTSGTSSSRGLASFSPVASNKRLALRKPLPPLDVDTANELTSVNSSLKTGEFLRAPLSAPLPKQDKLPMLRAPLARSSSKNNNHAKYEVTLATEAERTAFFQLRFGQMQQGMCKTVAKAWIKIIEPKKQTHCPYNKGEEGKPEWWPAGVRHKEPDHLMKPERQALLLTILRSSRIKVSRLQLATAEVVALIRADKVQLLMDVYRIARAEEAIREQDPTNVDAGKTGPVTVGVSTLSGWKTGSDGEPAGLSEEGRQATMGEDSPEADDKKRRKAPAANSRKRSASKQSTAESSSSTAQAGPGSKSKAKKAKHTLTPQLPQIDEEAAHASSSSATLLTSVPLAHQGSFDQFQTSPMPRPGQFTFQAIGSSPSMLPQQPPSRSRGRGRLQSSGASTPTQLQQPSPQQMSGSPDLVGRPSATSASGSLRRQAAAAAAAASERAYHESAGQHSDPPMEQQHQQRHHLEQNSNGLRPVIGLGFDQAIVQSTGHGFVHSSARASSSLHSSPHVWNGELQPVNQTDEHQRIASQHQQAVQSTHDSPALQYQQNFTPPTTFSNPFGADMSHQQQPAFQQQQQSSQQQPQQPTYDQLLQKAEHYSDGPASSTHDGINTPPLGALGLQGLPQGWAPGFATSEAGTMMGSGAAEWSSLPPRQQQQQPLQQNNLLMNLHQYDHNVPQTQPASAPSRMQPLSNGISGGADDSFATDTSMDRSFDTTMSTQGPATPSRAGAEFGVLVQHQTQYPQSQQYQYQETFYTQDSKHVAPQLASLQLQQQHFQQQQQQRGGHQPHQQQQQSYAAFFGNHIRDSSGGFERWMNE